MANQSARREGLLNGDTIAAAATAAGVGAIGIVRLSGPRALEIASLIGGEPPRARQAEFRRFRSSDGEPIDEGIVLFFPAPGSYTGEDVVELQCHGSPVVLDWLLETTYRYGARPAEPGEFSLRAFLNDRLDLTQAEAIADLIESSSRAAARAANRSLTGAFSERVSALQAGLTRLRVLCESWLDFPDEDIDHAALVQLEAAWNELRDAVADVLRAATHGRTLTDGLTIAIAGFPNVGKSSLLNRLAGIDAAIVTEAPGTTRDTIEQTVNVGGIAVTLVDMAGLRETADVIESEGIRRARAAISAAHHVLWVADVRDGLEAALGDAHRHVPDRGRLSLVLNKIDLIGGVARQFDDECHVLAISAKSGDGIAGLAAHLRAIAGADVSPGGSFSARRRHVDALERAAHHVDAAGPLLRTRLELAAEELRAAQRQLDELTGEHTSDELLGEIFSQFCIGK